MDHKKVLSDINNTMKLMKMQLAFLEKKLNFEPWNKDWVIFALAVCNTIMFNKGGKKGTTWPMAMLSWGESEWASQTPIFHSNKQLTPSCLDIFLTDRVFARI